jgi:hypothetical protein
MPISVDHLAIDNEFGNGYGFHTIESTPSL